MIKDSKNTWKIMKNDEFFSKLIITMDMKWRRVNSKIVELHLNLILF